MIGVKRSCFYVGTDRFRKTIKAKRLSNTFNGICIPPDASLEQIITVHEKELPAPFSPRKSKKTFTPKSSPSPSAATASEPAKQECDEQ